MPTGYTAAVVDGKITEFPEFALSCARAFGALITMRDDPADAPIPDEFAPSSYNETRLAEAKAALVELEALTPEQVADRAESSFTAAKAQHDEYEARCEEQERRLEAMQEKVLAWSPPTANHTEMKSFMLEQIEISKRGPYRSTPPVRLSPKEWHEDAIKKAMHDIEYHAGEQAKEVERARGRTEWLKALRASLASESTHD